MQDFTLNSSFSLLLLRILYVILPFIGISIEVNAQTDYEMPTSGTTTVNVVTGDRFFDSGGFNPSGAYNAVYDYGANQGANIIFEAPAGSIIKVTFVEFEVEDRGNRIYDNLQYYDGSGTGGTRLGRYYGTSTGSNTNRPSVVASSGNSLTFRFISDGSVEEEGWEAIIEVLSAPCSVGSEEIWAEDFQSNPVKGTSTSTRIKRQEYPGNQSGGWGLVGSNIGSLRMWQSNSIDISAFKDVRVSMDVGSWRNKMENGDYIDLSYSVDGAGFVEFSENGSLKNDIGAQVACSNISNGSNLVIKVSMYNNARNEFYYVDNISVTGELIAVGNPPNAICKDHTVSLDASGNASITPTNINNGSNDLETAESDLILSLDKRDFTCADLGDNTITLSVNDLDGNISTCTSTLTVQDLVAPSLLNLNAEYYTGINFNSLLYSEAVDEIDSDWGNGSPNAGLVGNDNFSVRYTGSFVVPETGNYIFYTNSDDGVRLAIDGSYVIDNWTDHGPTVDSGTRNLSKGEHTIALEYYERGGGAVIKLEWASADAGVSRQVFSKSSILNHTIIETTLTLNASGNATLAVEDVDPGFIDNCGVVDRSLSKFNFTRSDIGTNTVRLTVKDASGNSSFCDVVVRVEDYKVLPSVADCLGAKTICNASYDELSPDILGQGNVLNELPPFNNNCVPDEKNGIWYAFTPQNTVDADLKFSITPNNNRDDYDWIIFDVTSIGCEDLAGLDVTTSDAFVSGNTHGVNRNNGPTGADSRFGSGNCNGPGDTNGPKWNGDIRVRPGHHYVLYVSNWSESTRGYTIDFNQGGSAIIYDDVPPNLDGLVQACYNSNELEIRFTEIIPCGSLFEDDIMISVGASNYDVIGITSSECDSGGIGSDTYVFTLDREITDVGEFTLAIQSSGIKDMCGNVNVAVSELKFDVVGISSVGIYHE
ncbi:MAG: hypothetical protein COC06_09410 [Bacteroidales bacterium]|nr:MAG: hypothetical protein COC06_09410 [Bacteroidales bacterium]